MTCTSNCEAIRKFVEYFRVLNTGDRARWERAFEDTWHPEGVVDGWKVADLKEQHRRRLDSGHVQNVHVLRAIDHRRIEFSIEVQGHYVGPFIATFRDGRVYRVL